MLSYDEAMSGWRWTSFIALFIVLAMVEVAFFARENLLKDNPDPINFAVQAISSALGTAFGMGLVIWFVLRRSKKASP